MRSDPRHRIRSIRWKAKTESPEEGFRLREYLRHEGSDAFLGVAQEAFDEAAGDGDFLHVPRLEVTVKIDPAVGITAEAKQALLAQLRDQLREGNSSVGASSDEGRRERLPVEMSCLEILLHYLRTGSLPWHAENNAAAGAAGLATTAAEHLEGVVRELSAVPGNSVAPWLRLLLLLPESLFPVYTAVLVAPLSIDFFGMVPLLTALLEKRPHDFPRQLALRVAAHASQAVRSRRPVLQTLEQQLTTAEWKQFEEFIDYLPERVRELIRSLPPATTERKTGLVGAHGMPPERTPSRPCSNAPAPDPVEAGQKPIGSLTAGPAEERTAGSAMSAIPVPSPAFRADGLTLKGNASPPEVFVAFTPARAGRPGGEEYSAEDAASARLPEPDLFPILVENAGLLLLVPFLPRYLTNCGGMESGALAIPPEKLPRAAALLNFLVTGEQEVLEFQLPLVKVLLGLHPTAPLPVCGELLETNDGEEAEALLDAAISH